MRPKGQRAEREPNFPLCTLCATFPTFPYVSQIAHFAHFLTNGFLAGKLETKAIESQKCGSFCFGVLVAPSACSANLFMGCIWPDQKVREGCRKSSKSFEDSTRLFSGMSPPRSSRPNASAAFGEPGPERCNTVRSSNARDHNSRGDGHWSCRFSSSRLAGV
mgnify:CR=1 FL=1